MTDEQKIAFKDSLKKTCISLISERIEKAKELMKEVQQAANGEQKSSAGDKYETSRAMAHLEKDMNARQLAENLKELARLHSVETGTLYTRCQQGSYLETPSACFFIGCGLGRVRIGEKMVFMLSPQAPLARSLMEKESGHRFVFQAMDLVITDIF